MDRIPIFPLHTILFPHTDLGIHVFEERYRALVAACLNAGEGFGVVLIRHGREVAGPAEPHDVGTLAKISAHARLPDGRYLLEVEGAQRFRIHSVSGTTNGGPGYPTAQVTWLSDPIGDFGKARNAAEEVERLLVSYESKLGDAEDRELPADPVARSYAVAARLRIDVPEKQDLLESGSADERLAREAVILRREMSLLEAGSPKGRG